MRRSLGLLLAMAPMRVRTRVYEHPRLHRFARLFARGVYGDDGWRWQRVRTGAARGLWINARPRTHKFLISGRYEPRVQNYLVGELGPGCVLWDIGAHIGYVSLVAAQLGATVVAFEPVSENADRIEAVLERNALSGKVLRLAVSDADGVARMEMGSDSSTGRIGEVGSPIPCQSLDSLASGLPLPTHLKIDVEGHEIRVLRGARQMLRVVRPKLLIELHPEVARAQDVLGLLTAEYTIEFLDDQHIAATPLEAEVLAGVVA